MRNLLSDLSTLNPSTKEVLRYQLTKLKLTALSKQLRLQSELMALMRCLNLGKEARKNKPTIGLSLNPMLAQPGLGSTQSTIACFSGLSTYEMGEPSSTASPIPLVHSVTPTTIPSDIPKSLMLTIVVSNRQVEPPMLVSRS
nr:hypothetical protein CFP56_65295 [Quercus suber]